MLRLSATIGFGLRLTISNVFSSTFSYWTSEIANPFAKPQDSLPFGSNFYFFQLLEFCVLHWEYCSALAFGQEVYSNAVYTAIAVRIRAFDSTLVGKHVCSREGVLGSNFLSRAFAAHWRLWRNAPSKGHHSRYITLFFKGTYRVVSFYEMMRVSLAGLMHFLR